MIDSSSETKKQILTNSKEIELMLAGSNSDSVNQKGLNCFDIAERMNNRTGYLEHIMGFSKQHGSGLSQPNEDDCSFRM